MPRRWKASHELRDVPAMPSSVAAPAALGSYAPKRCDFFRLLSDDLVGHLAISEYSDSISYSMARECGMILFTLPPLLSKTLTERRKRALAGA